MAEDLREDLTHLLLLSLIEMSEEELLLMCCFVGAVVSGTAADDGRDHDS